MSNNASASFYQSTNSSTSTLRPRNNRLISYEDQSFQPSPEVRTTSTSSTPHDSRSVSPSATSSARSKGKPQSVYTRGTTSNTHKRNGSEIVDRRASGGIWDSWSSIQGIASTFLGNDVTASRNGNSSIKRSSSTNVRNTSGRMVQDKSYNLKQAQPEWGPGSQKDPKPTSIEDQKALLQAKRREALLLQSVDSGRDSFGRHKRKDSNASVRSPVENEIDVLVYRHKVQSNDTMAGVVIKYSCQPEVFRKVNRFWPNDNIQRREWVVLPVDACSVKGRRTEGPYVEALLQSTQEQTTSTDGASDGSRFLPPLTEPFPATELPVAKEEESEYRHDSWVLLPSHPQPVEILRISKRALGYFPPARRKSPHRTQPSTPYTDSATSTPKTSFDMLRHPPTHAAQQAQLNQKLQNLSLSSSPGRTSTSLPRHLTCSSRSRSSSTVSVQDGTSSNAFMTALSGPGGVGTLRGLRTERARPGPAEDPLNKKFAQYMPDMLPADHPDYQGSDGLRPPHARTASTSLSHSLNHSRRATPRASIDSIRSTRSNSSSVPAAIAGWVGKVASSPMRKKADLRLDRNNVGLTLSGIGENAADLIELSDTPDEVSRQLHDAEEERTPTATPRLEINSKALAGHGRTDEELMNERFPVRGRIRKAYEAD